MNALVVQPPSDFIWHVVFCRLNAGLFRKIAATIFLLLRQHVLLKSGIEDLRAVVASLNAGSAFY
jgi:hypothetical protein